MVVATKPSNLVTREGLVFLLVVSNNILFQQMNWLLLVYVKVQI